MRSITVAEGLVQLKRLDQRILKKIAQLDPIVGVRGGNIEHLSVSPEQFTKDTQADMQSIEAMIRLRRAQT